MADELSEASWTAFAKKRELDDASLVKALARLDKTRADQYPARSEALGEVVTQLKRQQTLLTRQAKSQDPKQAKENKAIKDQLEDMLDHAARLLKANQAAQAKAEAEAARQKEAQASAEEEPDTPALLSSKMITLIRELRKGTLQMHTLIARAGANTAVLIMRRAISASRRKLLAEAVQARGGLKYIVGTVRWENKALTFVVQSQAAGLAKRLRVALLEQVELRLKVRVHGEDGDEEDGEEDGEEEVEEDVDEEGKEATTTQAGAPSTAASVGAKIAPAIVYAQTRLVWVATRAKVQKDLKLLEDTILGHYKGQPTLPEVVQAVRKLDGVLALFDESLIDRLDQALQAKDPAAKAALHQEARAVISRYQEFLATDPLVQELDGNPFVPIAVQATLSKTLTTLAAKIV